MAESKVVTYTSLEDAKAACEKENAEVKEKGQGKERHVFAITVSGEHKFYVIATLSGKARAIAALALDIKANVAEKKAPAPQKSVVEQIATMPPDKLAEIRELLAKLERGEDPSTPAPPSEDAQPKKSRRIKSE